MILSDPVFLSVFTGYVDQLYITVTTGEPIQSHKQGALIYCEIYSAHNSEFLLLHVTKTCKICDGKSKI